jgi:hypothetical protein
MACARARVTHDIAVKIACKSHEPPESWNCGYTSRALRRIRVNASRVALLVAVSSAGCFQAPVTAGPSPQGDSPRADVVIEATVGRVSVKLGQIVAIRRPGGDELQWQLTGADDLFERLEPANDRPVGADGWKLRAKAAGDGELVFTGHASVTCADPPRCPPIAPPPTITLSVHISR